MSVLHDLKRKYNDKREKIRHESFAKEREQITESLLESRKRIIILSSDCVGGRLMKDFELPQYTPTVNNWYSGDDFMKICFNPDYYFSQDVIYNGLDSNGEPTGKMDDVIIHFGHTSGFNESYKKWMIGCKSYFRAKKKEHIICVVANDRNSFSENTLELYGKLPYKNKIIFVHKSEWDSDYDRFYMNGEDSLPHVNVMTLYESKLSCKRRYDRFNFAEWFLRMIQDADSYVG